MNFTIIEKPSSKEVLVKILSEVEKIKIEARENLIEKSEKRLDEIPWWRIFERFKIEKKMERYRREIFQIENN